jgi:peptidoglycan/LPS O-acetylase OafA/YrhL
MKQRVSFVDCLRVACIGYLVCYWHLFNYTSFFPGYHNRFTVIIAVLALGTFVFISGYLAGGKEIEPTLHCFLGYYRGRIIRIYPLYMGALLLYLAFGLIDLSTLRKAAIGVSMFYGPPPRTLWFVTMILVFYVVAPFLLVLLKSRKLYILMAASIFACMLLAIQLSPAGDRRIALYFPVFVLGILFANQRSIFDGLWWLVLFGFLGAVVVTANSMFDPELSMAGVGIATLGPVLVYLCCNKYRDIIPASAAVKFISVNSFAIYLLHRPIFEAMKRLYFPESGPMQVLYLFSVCLPVIVLISCAIQRAYDKLVAGFGLRKATLR